MKISERAVKAYRLRLDVDELRPAGDLGWTVISGDATND